MELKPKKVPMTASERQKKYLSDPANMEKHKERQKRYRKKQSAMARYIKENKIILHY